MMEETNEQKCTDLLKIQNELNVPKAQRNSFGNYNYRSCEDIVEAVKPLLHKHNCTCFITDTIEHHGDRYYIVANAHFRDSEGGLVVVKGYAREPENKKGMDESQITGAASSYARKYALNGLFMIDDTKDADTKDNSESGYTPQKGDGQQSEERELKASEVEKQWNGKVYGKSVFINNVKIFPPAEQLSKLKKHPKYIPNEK